jgi:hypothetical protein
MYNNPYYNFLQPRQPGPVAMAAVAAYPNDPNDDENVDPRLRGLPPTQGAAAAVGKSWLHFFI